MGTGRIYVRPPGRGNQLRADVPPGRTAFPTSVSIVKAQRYLKPALSWTGGGDDDDDNDVSSND